MKITRIQSLYEIQATSLHAPKKMQQGGQPCDQSRRPSSCDSIQVSSQASLQVGLEAKCKEYANGWEESISSQRIEALKLKYQGDQCPVSGKEVAMAMMERVTGTFE